MPAADFRWMQQSGVFQVYGSKRKHEWTEERGDSDMKTDLAAKRHCPIPSECGDAMNEMFEINHNSIPTSDAPQAHAMEAVEEINHNSIPLSAQQPSQVVTPPQDQSFVGQPLLHHNSQLQQQHLLHLQQQSSVVQHIPDKQQENCSQEQNTMVMDLSDETYSNPVLDKETQLMYSNMDSDCVANLQQYGGGERSPTSGRVRCYCKPSWEGLMEMIPYVNDYY